VPGTGDTAVFGRKSHGGSIVDPGFAGTVARLKLGPGFPGTVSLARSLDVTKSFSEKAGAFSAGGQR
jgi:hypothetical protein